MSADFRQENKFPCIKTFQVNASTGIATKLLIPNRVKRIQVGSASNALYISHTGEDGQLMSSTDRGFIPKDNLLTLNIGSGETRNDTLFVSGQVGSEVVVVILEEAL